MTEVAENLPNKTNPRQLAVWAALLLTLGATLWTALAEESGPDDLAAKPVRTSARSSHVAPATPATTRMAQDRALTSELDVSALTRPRLADEIPGDLFGSSANTEQANAASELAPAAQTVPGIPYTYAGKLQEDGRYTVFLTADNMNYVVKQGDVIGPWQVQSIKPPHMVLRYKPLKADVTMMIGEAS